MLPSEALPPEEAESSFSARAFLFSALCVQLCKTPNMINREREMLAALGGK